MKAKRKLFKHSALATVLFAFNSLLFSQINYPVVTSTPIIQCVEMDYYNYKITVDDIDSTVQFNVKEIPYWLKLTKINAKTALLSGQCTSAPLINGFVNILISDSRYNIEHKFTILTTICDPPQFATQPPLNGYVDSLYSYNFEAFQISGRNEDVHIERYSSIIPNWLTLDETSLVMPGEMRKSSLNGIPPQEGDYPVYLVIRYGYSGNHQEFTIHVSKKTSALEVRMEPRIVVYPNPVIHTINISELIDEIILTDISGKVISSGSLTNKLDVSGFAAGIYFIKIKKAKNRIVIQKIIKQ